MDYAQFDVAANDCLVLCVGGGATKEAWLGEVWLPGRTFD